MLNKPNAHCAGRRKDREKKNTFKAFKNLPYMQTFQKKKKSYKPFSQTVSSIQTRFVCFLTGIGVSPGTGETAGSLHLKVSSGAS